MSRATAPLPVNIRKNADVDNEIVNLRISEGEQLTWSADPESGGFTIEFPITPFASKTFVVARRAMRSVWPHQPGCADHAVFL